MSEQSGWEEIEGWKPEPGDSVNGKVIAIEKGFSNYTNDFYPIVTLQRDEDSPINVHCFHAILVEKLKTFRPAIGERVIITRGPDRPVKNSTRTVVLYKVEMPDRTNDTSGWDAFGAAPAPTPVAPDIPVAATDSGEDIPF